MADLISVRENATLRTAAVGIAALACRSEAGLTIREAAAMSKWGKTWLWRVENGKCAVYDWRTSWGRLSAIYPEFPRVYRAARDAIVGHPRGTDPIARAMAAAHLAARGVGQESEVGAVPEEG